jgi:hypothetical protein
MIALEFSIVAADDNPGLHAVAIPVDIDKTT